MDYESGRAIPNNQVLSKIERAIGEFISIVMTIVCNRAKVSFSLLRQVLTCVFVWQY